MTASTHVIRVSRARVVLPRPDARRIEQHFAWNQADQSLVRQRSLAVRRVGHGQVEVSVGREEAESRGSVLGEVAALASGLAGIRNDRLARVDL